MRMVNVDEVREKGADLTIGETTESVYLLPPHCRIDEDKLKTRSDLKAACKRFRMSESIPFRVCDVQCLCLQQAWPATATDGGFECWFQCLRCGHDTKRVTCTRAHASMHNRIKWYTLEYSHSLAQNALLSPESRFVVGERMRAQAHSPWATLRQTRAQIHCENLAFRV